MADLDNRRRMWMLAAAGVISLFPALTSSSYPTTYQPTTKHSTWYHSNKYDTMSTPDDHSTINYE